MLRLSAQSAIWSVERCLRIKGATAVCMGCIKNLEVIVPLRQFHVRPPQLARGTRQVVNLDVKSEDHSQDIRVPEAVETEPSSLSDASSTAEAQYTFPSLPKGAKDEEIYEGIMEMKPKEIFYLLQHYHGDLNKTHFALSMKRLHRIYKTLPVDSKEDYKTLLHNQDGFKLLCALLALKGEYYEPPIVADMLLFLHELGLDSRDPTMQVYLHSLSHNLHRLTLDVILKVMKCSVSMTTTSQVKLLKQGVKILAEKSQLTKGITALTVAELVNMLDLIGGFLPQDDLKLLLKEISLIEDNISPRLSVILLKGLRHLESPHYLEVEAINKIILKTEKLSPNSVIEVLEACWNIDLYHFELLDKIESKAMEKYDISDQFKVVKWLYKFGYLAKRLLPIIQDCPEQLVNLLNSRDLLILLEVISDGSHRVDLDDQFMQFLKAKLEKINYSELSLEDNMKCLTHLYVLDHGHCDIAKDIHKFLDNEDVIQHFMESSAGKHAIDQPLWRLHMLNLVQNYKSVTGSDSSIHEFLKESSMPSHTASMGNMIATALETENCVVTRPKSKEGIVIDHLILLDENSKPVNLMNKRNMFLEDCNLEGNHKIVSIMEMPGTCLHRNTRQLRGFYAWYMRQLQSRGHLVVLINTELFDKVEDENKYEYIRRKIFSAEKFQDLVLLS